TTIGGGVITDPWPREAGGGRRAAGRNRDAEPVVPSGNDATDVARMIRRRGGSGMTRAELGVAAGLDEARLTAAPAEVFRPGRACHDDWFVGSEEVEPAV